MDNDCVINVIMFNVCSPFDIHHKIFWMAHIVVNILSSTLNHVTYYNLLQFADNAFVIDEYYCKYIELLHGQIQPQANFGNTSQYL